MKTCARCKNDKDPLEFYKQSGTSDGLARECISCSKQRQVDNYAKKEKQELEAREKDPESWKKIVAKRLWSSAQKRAKVLGREFTISVDDIDVPLFCPVLGVPLLKSANTLSVSSPSLDRLDNDIGYISGNIRGVSARLNWLKGDLTKDQIKRLYLYSIGEL